MIRKPLAYRMRPKTLDGVLGQKRTKAFLKNLIERESLLNMIFYGPPGTGKTTLAEAFAKTFNIHSLLLNAVSNTKAELQSAFSEAIRFAPSLVIIDEIHRLDKPKQDLLLPHLENGDFYLIGCTTANPLISLNPAIRSRTRLFEIERLSKDEIKEGLVRAIQSKEGLDNEISFAPEALDYLSSIAAGDLRFALNSLEAVSMSFADHHEVTLEETKEIASVPNYLSDLNENEHYDTVSAFQKSIRGRDADAAIYYLAKLLKGGDLEGCIRRLMVTAYEDIGLGNPAAVNRCYHACQVALSVGLPEAMIPLGFTVIDLAISPHSRSAAEAIEKASADLDSQPLPVRSYLRYHQPNVATQDSYPYDRNDIWPHLVYLPEGKEDEEYYFPQETGRYERALKEEYLKLKADKKFDSVREARYYASSNRKK